MSLPPALPTPVEGSGYVSPYGAVVGLRARLAKWAERMARDHSLPWAGVGILKDLEAAVQLLDVREFAEWLRANGPAEHQRFADDILANEETLSCLNMVLEPGGADPVKVAEDMVAAERSHERLLAAVETATGKEFDDPIAAVQTLASESAEAAAMRKVLVDTGALAFGDATTDTAALLRALLS